jgi:hypothetical protein
MILANVMKLTLTAPEMALSPGNGRLIRDGRPSGTPIGHHGPAWFHDQVISKGNTMLKFLTGIVALAVVATAANAAERQACITVSYDHQGVNDNNKPNTQQYIASQTGADVRCEAVQAPTFGWQPSAWNLADKHPTIRQ